MSATLLRSYPRPRSLALLRKSTSELDGTRLGRRLEWIAKLLSLSETLAVFSEFLDSAPHFPCTLEPVFEVDLASHLARVQAELGKPVLPAPLQSFLDNT